ncbi:Aste57867_21881 [Aphanomyces stellatus]|uniref:Aste57867_21881 protein n=1 Tax=Aphanomyces stellatus TaxID=120398 RepID=A0A485LIP5_9STRA|nr:hypothetical protein As57867_021812 [Aphanomyces stellatus]VFT98549.1 Aste57867_21881 [Aphanomyces stellatus]
MPHCDVFELGFRVPAATYALLSRRQSEPVLKSPLFTSKTHTSDGIFDVHWIPNSASRVCFVCKDLFGVFRNRRHHCRLCGQLVCNPCSQARSFVRKSAPAVKLERTCVTCSGTLRQLASLGDTRVKLTTSSSPSKPHSASAAPAHALSTSHKATLRKYVVSAAWYASYKMSAIDKSQPLGPIANHSLLYFFQGRLHPKPSLSATDYHVLDPVDWLKLFSVYGGGPCITVPSNDVHNHIAWSIRFTTKPTKKTQIPEMINNHADIEPQSVPTADVERRTKARDAAAAFARAASLARREAEGLAMRKSMASLADFEDLRQSLNLGSRSSRYSTV